MSSYIEWLTWNKTPTQLFDEYKSFINKSIRQMDRERDRLQRQEKGIIAEIKRLAKLKQYGPMKSTAKQLVQLRKTVNKFHEMRTQMLNIYFKMQTLTTTQQLTDAMKGLSRAMGIMNRQMNLPHLQRFMMNFNRQLDQLEVREELMNDTIDTAIAGPDDEEAEEDLVQQILDELQLKTEEQMKTVKAPKAKPIANNDANEKVKEHIKKD